MKLLYSRVKPLMLVVAAGCSAQAASSTTAPVIDLGYVKYAGYQNTTAGIDYY